LYTIPTLYLTFLDYVITFCLRFITLFLYILVSGFTVLQEKTFQTPVA
jgi:hypothetical protein